MGDLRRAAAPASSLGSDSAMRPAALVTIRMQDIYRALLTNYTRLLEEAVFTRDAETFGENRKILKSFRKILESEEANLVLSILWRESPYVSEDELAYDGYSKLFFEKPLTSYHLTVYLANSKNEVAATNSRVRLIIAAGAAFGLVDKRQLTCTKAYIFGTEFLHDFMVRLGFENAKSCVQILWQDLEGRITPQSFLSIPFTPST
jgi:hypothetical protein